MNKSTNIIIRVSEQDKGIIKSMARIRQMSISEYIRYLARMDMARNNMESE